MLSIHANLKSILTYVILVWMVEVPIYYYCYPKMRLLLHFLLPHIVHLPMAGPFQTGILSSSYFWTNRKAENKILPKNHINNICP